MYKYVPSSEIIKRNYEKFHLYIAKKKIFFLKIKKKNYYSIKNFLLTLNFNSI